VVGRLGSGNGIQVSATFQKIICPMSWLGLESGPHVVGRLGLGPRVVGWLWSGLAPVFKSSL